MSKGSQLQASSHWEKDKIENESGTSLRITAMLKSNWSIQKERGGAVAQSVEHATPDEEVPGSIPTVAACSLLVGSVSV